MILKKKAKDFKIKICLYYTNNTIEEVHNKKNNTRMTLINVNVAN